MVFICFGLLGPSSVFTIFLVGCNSIIVCLLRNYLVFAIVLARRNSIIVCFLWRASVFAVFLIARCAVSCSVRRHHRTVGRQRLSVSLGGFPFKRLSLVRLYVAGTEPFGPYNLVLRNGLVRRGRTRTQK